MNLIIMCLFGGFICFYYICNFFFSLIFFMVFIFIFSFGKESFFGGLFVFVLIFMVVSCFFYFYFWFVYESVVNYIVGCNMFFVNVVLMLVVKFMIMFLCWYLVIFIVLFGLVYFFFCYCLIGVNWKIGFVWLSIVFGYVCLIYFFFFFCLMFYVWIGWCLGCFYLGGIYRCFKCCRIGLGVSILCYMLMNLCMFRIRKLYEWICCVML